MSDVRIPDIAEFQGLVDHLALVAGLRQAYGAAIVIARINYGNTAIDQQADRNIDGLRAAGADAIGWYCYLISSQDPAAQADTFCRVLQVHGGLRLNEFVVCDDEEGSGDQSSRVDAFLSQADAVLQAAAAQDAWYSDLNFAQAHNLPAASGHRWIAAYQSVEPTAVAHDLWQFTDAMSFPGIAQPCDASVFHGTLSDFLALIGAGGDMLVGLDPNDPVVEALRNEQGVIGQLVTDLAQVDANGDAAQFPNGTAAQFVGVNAKLDALLKAEGVAQAGIDAIAAKGAAASQVTTLLANLANLQTSVTNLANLTAGTLPPSQQAELDAIKAATDGLTATAAATAKHLGVGTA